MSPAKYELAATPGFLDSLEALDKRHRKAVNGTLEKLHAGHASVHVHKLEGVPFVSFDVSKEGVRVICHREGETLLLLYADLHKPAYDWCKRNRVVRVGRTIRLMRSEVVMSPAAGEIANEPPPPVIPRGPLAALSDETFALLDVKPPTARALRSVPDEDALLALLDDFPSPRGEALLALVDEPDEIEGAKARYASALERATAPTLEDALRDDTNAAVVWRLSPEDEAFRRALEGDFDAWRVFLHPSQRRVVNVRARGALKVTGGPGTGKTVVALHRAKHIAESLPEGETVLITVFSAVLAKQLELALDRLCPQGSDTRSRIEVRSVLGVARDVLAAAGKPHALITDLDPAWEAALAHDAAGRGRRFFEAEREQVLARSDAWDEVGYLKASRAGRAERMDRVRRKEVWRVLEAFEASLLAQGGGDGTALARAARDVLASGELASPFAAVVCDEAQDLGAAELRLLATLATDPTTGRIRDDGLTLTGDGYQRIYRVPISLLACGIETRGRSRVLRLNYRTTESIRRAAVQALGEAGADPMDEDAASSIDGYRSLRDGPPPEEKQFETPEQEADWIASLAAAPTTLLVLARTNAWLDQLAEFLRARGKTPRILGAEDLAGANDALLLATMHRAKGLEAPRVVVAGRQQIPARFPGGSAEDRERWQRQERCLLYVALTRARDWCGVSRVSD